MQPHIPYPIFHLRPRFAALSNHPPMPQLNPVLHHQPATLNHKPVSVAVS